MRILFNQHLKVRYHVLCVCSGRMPERVDDKTRPLLPGTGNGPREA